MADTAAASGAAALRSPPVRLLIAFSIVGPLTIHLILPSLPYLQDSFATDYATVQLLISVYVVAFGVAQLVIGPLADLLGRKRVLVAGLALYAVASLVSVAAWSIETLILLRICQAVGACAGTVIARSAVQTHYADSEATRILGYLAIGIALGPLIAPTLGGLLFELAGWQAPFAAMAMLGGVCLILALRQIPGQTTTSARPAGRQTLRQDVRHLIRSPAFVLNWLGVSCNSGVVFTFIVGAPWIAKEFLALSPAAFGLWYGMSAVGYAAGNYLAGLIARHLTRERMVQLGAGLVALCSATMVAVFATGLQQPMAVFGTFTGIMFGSGLVMPNSFAGAMGAEPRAAASASGFVGAGQYVVGAMLSTLATTWMETGHDPLYLGGVMAVSSLCGVAAAFGLSLSRAV